MLALRSMRGVVGDSCQPQCCGPMAALATEFFELPFLAVFQLLPAAAGGSTVAAEVGNHFLLKLERLVLSLLGLELLGPVLGPVWGWHSWPQ